MSIALDIIIVAIVLFFAIRMYRRGFAVAAVQIAGYLALVTCGLMVSQGLSNVTYRTLVEPAVCSTIEGHIATIGTDGATEVIDAVYDGLPEIVVTLSENRGVTREALGQQLTENITEGASAAASAVASTLIKPIVTSVFTVVFLLLIMVIGGWAVKLLAKLADKIFSAPVVGGLNHLLGGVLGIAQGALWATVFTWLVSMVVMLTADGFIGINAEVIGSTYIFKLVSSLNPLA